MQARIVRPARRDEPGHGPHLAPIRQRIESIIWTAKDILTLERHGARTLPGLRERILQRFCCVAACITLNHQLGRPSRALIEARARTEAARADQRMTSTACSRVRPAMLVSQTSASMPTAAAIGSTSRWNEFGKLVAQRRERVGDPDDAPARAKRQLAAPVEVWLEREAQTS